MSQREILTNGNAFTRTEDSSIEYVTPRERRVSRNRVCSL